MILKVRLKGTPETQFQNIDVPFGTMEEFAAALGEGEIIVCDSLRTRSSVPGEREIIARTDIGITREGIDWMTSPSIKFTEAPS